MLQDCRCRTIHRIGVNDDFVYRYERVTLQKSESLFFYSDDVTEAADLRATFFPEAWKMGCTIRDAAPESLFSTHIHKNTPGREDKTGGFVLSRSLRRR
jgi:hypothetical protein